MEDLKGMYKFLNEISDITSDLEYGIELNVFEELSYIYKDSELTDIIKDARNRKFIRGRKNDLKLTEFGKQVLDKELTRIATNQANDLTALQFSDSRILYYCPNCKDFSLRLLSFIPYDNQFIPCEICADYEEFYANVYSKEALIDELKAHIS